MLLKDVLVVRSSHSYLCDEVTPEELVDIVNEFTKFKLSPHFSKVLRNNVDIYKNNPNNQNIKDKTLNLVVENISRRFLFKNYNMLTHSTDDNRMIIVKIKKSKRNESSVNCYGSSSITTATYDY